MIRGDARPNLTPYAVDVGSNTRTATATPQALMHRLHVTECLPRRSQAVDAQGVGGEADEVDD